MFHTVEIYVMIDADGEYVVSKERDGAEYAYDEDICGTSPRRLLKLELAVPVPKPITLKATVPPESEVVELKIA